jgi:hypothetical protein
MTAMRSTISGKKDRTPVIGLHPAHGETEHELDPRRAEYFGHQAVLEPDVVIHGDVGISAPIERQGQIAGRGRQAIAQHVRDHDEIAAGIERVSGLDQPFRVVVLRAIRRGVDDDIRFVGRKLAVGLVGQLGAPEGHARLKHNIARIEDSVVGHADPSERWNTTMISLPPRENSGTTARI